MSNQVEEIKNRVDIVDFIGQYVDLKKSGRNFKGLCPFHQEKSPSFVVSPERQIWHCFGTCGVGGDVISFLMKWENLSFYEALKELGDEVGITIESSEYDDEEWKEKERIYKINETALKYYKYLLNESKYGKTALAYLKERGINDRIIETFELGYAPSSWNSLLQYLHKKNFSDKDIIAAGIAIPGKRVYDRFRNRLVFPLKDTRGNVVGFSGRVLDSTKKQAKYVNTPETLAYHKRENLFGISITKDEIRKADAAYIVEGEFDLITPFQNGVGNIVAIKGSAFTKEQLDVLRRYTKKIILALDMDDAGIEAIKRGIKLAEENNFDVYVVRFSQGKDPDEAVKKNKIQFKKDMENYIPIYDFLIEEAQKKYPEKTSFQKRKIGEEVLPFIQDIKNPIVKSHYTKLISEILSVSEGSIYQMIRELRFKKKTNFPVSKDSKKQTVSRSVMIQRFFLSNLLQTKNFSPETLEIIGVINPEDFTFPSYEKIYKVYKSMSKGLKSFNYTDFVKVLPAETRATADEVYMFAVSQESFSKSDISKLGYEMKANSLKKEIEKATESQDDKEDSNLKSLFEELKTIQKKVRSLSLEKEPET